MLLKANNINFKYRGDKYILKDVSLKIDSSEIVGIVAPSGFGKSTLAKILAGYIKPDKGKVSLEGEDSDKKNLIYDSVKISKSKPKFEVEEVNKI